MNNIFELNKNKFNEVCPYCRDILEINKYIFYGWRNLYDCSCNKCKSNFLIDMPIFSGIPYPSVYDKDKNEIVNDVDQWWGKPLEKILSRTLKDNVISDIKNNKNNNKVIIFNLLDFVFGHSFMRLERLTYYIDNQDFKEYDLLVLIPFQLRYLIKNFEKKLSIIEIKLSFPQYRYFYTSINEQVNNIIEKYNSVYCEMLKYPQQEFLKLEILNLPINKWVEDIKKVVIVYRKDRTIGVTNRAQYKFYKKLIYLMKKIDIEIFIIGDKDKYSFKEIHDLRIIKFDKNTDELWNETCSGAITIGVHGSNMLIPSLCSAYNIEFVTYDKLYNFGQATAFLETLNQQETIQKYRYIYGNDYLTDINPFLVYEMVKSIVIRMNNTFNSVEKEKYKDLPEVRLSYEKSNVIKRNISLYEKICKIIYKIRKKVNV